MEFLRLSSGASQLRKFSSRAAKGFGKKIDSAIVCLDNLNKSFCRFSKDGWNQVDRRTKKKPFSTLAIATGTGLVLGWLIGKDRKR